MKNLLISALTPLLLAMFMVTLLGGCEDEDNSIIGLCPTVVSTSPLDEAIAVPLNQVISATFNEALDPDQINQGSIILTSSGSPSGRTAAIAGTITYDPETFMILFTPSDELEANLQLTAVIPVTIQDELGNALQSSYSWTFTTASYPSVVSNLPLDLATNVSLNPVVSATFSESMDMSSITATSFTLMQGTSMVAGIVAYANNTATFTPSGELTEGESYTANISTNAKSTNGLALEADHIWTFSTGLTPTVNTSIPVDLAANINLSQVLSATFSEAMDSSSITTSSFILMQDTTAVPGAVTYTGSTATFTPENDLLADMTYTATITTAVKSANGFTLEEAYVWTFTTGLSPTVISTAPLDQATDLSLPQIVSATFSQEMDSSSINNTTFTLMQGTTAITGVVTYLDKTAVFTPTNGLSAGMTYTANITTGAISANGFALSNPLSWSFTISDVIITPTVVSSVPINLATNVSLNQAVSVTFSEVMNATTITGTSFTLKEGTTAVTGVVTYTGTTATLTPSIDLLPGKTYTATISTAVINTTGVSLVNAYVWSFSTPAAIGAPTVSATAPLNLATNVPLNQTVTATFSEAMNAATITDANFTLKQGTTAVAGTISYTGTTATFQPSSDLLVDKTYTATITTDAKNTNNIALENDYQWNFSTAATIDPPFPTVLSTIPVNLASNVSLSQALSASFSETMNSGTITQNSFTLKEGTNTISGLVTYSGTTATFTPNSNLLAGKTYTATITTDAENTNSIALENDYQWSFSTAAAVINAPIIDLKSLLEYGIIAGVGVSNNAGPSEIRDMNVGIFPGVRSSITGFFSVDGGPGSIINGVFKASDDPAPTPTELNQAKLDLVAAYDEAAGATSPAPAVAPPDLGGKTLAPGIYVSATTMLLQNGDLTLDAQGDPNAFWIFKVGSAFTSIGGAGGNVILSGGAKAKNVFWQVSSSATIGDNTIFKGNILALTSITMNSGAVAEGRMLCRNGSVVLTNANIITRPIE